MKKRLPLITLRPLAWILFLLITASGYAQESLIQGLVIDENGEPLIGVSIQDQKTQKGTISDIDGKFSLEARIGNMLKISYIGYRTVTLAAAKDMRVVMSEDNMKLDEVVVVGYGVQKKVNLTGAVSMVKGDVLRLTNLYPRCCHFPGGNFTYLYHRWHRTPGRRLCPHRSQ